MDQHRRRHRRHVHRRGRHRRRRRAAHRQGAVDALRIPSAAVRTRPDAAAAASGAIDAGEVERFVHGTTVATNAVLERKGARLGPAHDRRLRGRDRDRPPEPPPDLQLMLKPETPVFLAPGARRRGVVEAIGPDGAVVTPLDVASLERAVDAAGRRRASRRSRCASCFRSSIRRTSGARPSSSAKRHPALVVSMSSEVDPAFREYERTVRHRVRRLCEAGLDRYLASMESDLASSRRPRAAADHAVARRRVLGARGARSGRSACSCRALRPASSARASRGSRSGMKTSSRRHRRHQLRHRADRRTAGR